MEIKLAVTFILVVFSTIELGEALECYQGVHGTHVKKVTCAGSCTTVTATVSGSKTTAVACVPVKQKDGCQKLGEAETCFCSDQLCNKDTTVTTTKATPKGGTSGMRAHVGIVAMVLCFLVGKRAFQL